MIGLGGGVAVGGLTSGILVPGLPISVGVERLGAGVAVSVGGVIVAQGLAPLAGAVFHLGITASVALPAVGHGVCARILIEAGQITCQDKMLKIIAAALKRIIRRERAGRIRSPVNEQAPGQAGRSVTSSYLIYKPEYT